TTAQGTIDNILKEFYDKHSLPGGVSLAISYRGRLVYAGTIGYADKERKIPLTKEHRMRIASLSKPITAIAIMNCNVPYPSLRVDRIPFWAMSRVKP
ncbi:MAG: beta-lactamase family protein, partial [Planctomycetaceae bacterium]|nr:beta-lactamase family protein [Planctomycetaceae bacterium]